MQYVIEKGENIRLTKQIGQGGEGSVFLIENKPGLVAKIYHNKNVDGRESKLHNMLHLSSQKLNDVSSWPIKLIKKKSEEGVAGIILPYVDGLELHTVYGPNERKQILPNATWEFLLCVARNLAIVFDTIHSHNVIIGDVNEKNFKVDKNAIVKIIDCDSFQIPSRTGFPFLCKVGVEHYTPPELQGADLSSCQRTTSHDCFGLAVLIFQLLFMARHPFAMLSKDLKISSLTIGESIKSFLYAYSQKASTIGIYPPPLTININILPQSILGLFETAFSPPNINHRPSATQWAMELQKVLKTIVTCRNDSSHKYCNHLPFCPWCDFYKKTMISFFIPIVPNANTNPLNADINSLHVAISQISKISFIKKDPLSYTFAIAKGNPIPFYYKLPAATFHFGVLITISSLLIGFYMPLLFVGIILGIPLILIGRHIGKYKEEIKQRKSQYDSCKQKVIEIYSKLQGIIDSYNKIYDREREKISNEFSIYSKLSTEREQLLVELKSKNEKLQLQKHLQKYLIIKSRIKEIGDSRTHTLVSYGIETAADVTHEGIKGIPGFGKHLRGVLLAWRIACEKEFKFDYRKPIPQSDIDEINKHINAKSYTLKEDLNKSINSLKELNRTIMARYTETENCLPDALKKFYEAETNWKALKTN
jgi:DNA-binding helix-hairpin-helix protein with protein kinase domain